MELQKIYKMEKIISKINILWMAIVVASIAGLHGKMDSQTMLFYRFGPSDSLIVFGLTINTFTKYIIIMIYLCTNSFVRTMNHNILSSWVTNRVQDITIEKNNEIKSIAYEITYGLAIYSWVDFFIYINILLAQVDMLLIEILINVIISGVITNYYLNYRGKSCELTTTTTTNEIELIENGEQV
jgi:hypothetical protein